MHRGHMRGLGRRLERRLNVWPRLELGGRVTDHASAALAALALASAALAGALVTGCAHTDSFREGVLQKGSLRIELGPVPSTWRRVELEGADLAFRDDDRSGSALFDVRCEARDNDAPLGILTQNLIMGTTQREVESQEIIPFDRREAMHSRLRARLDGVPMQYEIYVMKKDGCVYDLVYIAPPDRFADGAGDFERFVSGLRTLPAAAAAVGPSRDP